MFKVPLHMWTKVRYLGRKVSVDLAYDASWIIMSAL